MFSVYFYLEMTTLEQCVMSGLYIYYLVKSKNFILRTLNVIMNVDFIGHYKIENNFHNLFLLTLICITAVQVNFQ